MTHIPMTSSFPRKRESTMRNLGPRLRGDDELLSPSYVKLNSYLFNLSLLFGQISMSGMRSKSCGTAISPARF